MYIRLDLSGQDKRLLPEGIEANSCFPLQLERGLIIDLFPHLSPSAIAVYVTLLHYDTLSGEVPTPSRARLKELHFPNWSDVLFDEAIYELVHTAVNGKQLVCLE